MSSLRSVGELCRQARALQHLGFNPHQARALVLLRERVAVARGASSEASAASGRIRWRPAVRAHKPKPRSRAES